MLHSGSYCGCLHYEFSLKVNTEYGAVKNLSGDQRHDQGNHGTTGQGNQLSSSSALVLAGNSTINSRYDPYIFLVAYQLEYFRIFP